jgi:hypothetical protein
MVNVSQNFGVGKMKNLPIPDHTARQIALLAAKRQKRPEVLANEILEQYIILQSMDQEQSCTAFLLSIAGMFDSGPGDTSEHVQPVVADSILHKHRDILHESTRR